MAIANGGTPFPRNVPILQNLSFDATSSDNTVNVCDAVSANGGDGLRGIAIEDLQGSLTGESGWLLQDKNTDPTNGIDYPDYTTFLPPGSCAPIEDSCLVSCPNTCFRTLLGSTPSSPIHASTRMKVTDATGKVMLIPRMVFGNKALSLDHRTRAQFSVRLPSSSAPYNVTWVNEDDGEGAWPGFGYLVFSGTPSCQNHITESDLNLIYPLPNDRCNNAIYNGDIETGLKDGWQGEFNTPFAATEQGTGAAGTSYAIKTTNINRNPNHGLWNYLDVSCLRAWASEGKWIRFSGYFRTLDSSNVDAVSSVNVRLSADDESISLLPVTTISTSGDGNWTHFEQSVELPSSVADATEAILVIDGASGHYIVADELLIEVIEPTQEPNIAVSLLSSLYLASFLLHQLYCCSNHACFILLP